MFSTFKQKLLLGIYIFILLSIPVGTYLVSEHQTTIKSQAKEEKGAKSKAVVSPKPTTSSVSPAKKLLDSLQTNSDSDLTSPSPSSPTIATSYGPTLSLKANLEGRPKNNQATQLFVGIADGTLTANPKFLLNFTVDLPATGEYSGLSLAGLSTGTSYTALLKGSAQIATSSAFTMSPNITSLNSGQPLNLISGDLNDDNVINSADYSIVRNALGSTSDSSNWNANADFNLDGLINAFDLAIIVKNMGRVGASGAWVSPIPQIATTSGELSPATGSPQGRGGYWIWVPK